MKTFTKKGYGRIYVQDPNHIQLVSNIIEEIDDWEYGFMPAGYITEFQNYPQVIYNHKFCDLDINKITATCWSRGIIVFCYDAGIEEYPASLIVKPKEIHSNNTLELV